MTRPPKDEDPTVVRANADTRVGSKRVRQLPTDSGDDVAVLDSAESNADAFDAPQATELLDPANLPDAIRNSLRNRAKGGAVSPPAAAAKPSAIAARSAAVQAVAPKAEAPASPPGGFPRRDDDATVTFDPASLEQAHPDRTLARDAGAGSSSRLTGPSSSTAHPSGAESSSSRSTGAGESWEDHTVAADSLIASSIELKGQEEAGFAPPTGAEFVPPMHTLPDHVDSVPDPLSDTDDAKRPSWLGSAQPVDLGLSETAQASPFADEKKALPGAGAFGPIDHEAVQAEAKKSGGRGKIFFALLLSVGVVAMSVVGALALGLFDGEPEIKRPDRTAAQPAAAAPEAAPATPSPAAAAPEASSPAMAAPAAAAPEGGAPDGAFTGDGVPETATGAPNGKGETETEIKTIAAAAPKPPPNAKPVPIGFVRVLDNTKSKLPELAETLQQSLLREIKNHPSLDARLGPIPIGHLVELRLQTIEIDGTTAAGKRRKAEADCSLVVRPTPLEGDAETRNAHATIETGLAVTTKLERSAVATLAIAACGKALAVSLVGYAGEHPIDWAAAAAAIAAETPVVEDAKASKDTKVKKRKKSRRGKAVKKRRRRRATGGRSQNRRRAKSQ